MNIVFVCDTMGSGGAERVIATLSNSFVSLGHDVSILMLSRTANESFYALDQRIRMLRLDDKNARFFKKAKLLRRSIIEHQPDVVIAFLSYVCIYTWWALKKTKIPYIVSERNDPNHRGKAKQFLLDKSFKKAAGCVFQTEDALRWYQRVVRDKGVVIYNPASVDCTLPIVSKRRKQVLYVGRITEQKNCLMLIDAFELFSRRHPDYSLKMYGSGPLEVSLIEYVRTKGLEDKVRILPNSKTWQKDEYDSAMFVLPSKYEGMPNVLTEALCLGIPSVSTDCAIGGPKELKKVFPNLLVLSETEDPKDFAAAMERALSIQNERPCIPESLRADNIAGMWMNYIQSVTGGAH